jgi:hypothetical protein
MRNSEWFEYETNVHRAAEVIVDHVLRITAEHGTAPSAMLDLAICSVIMPDLLAEAGRIPQLSGISINTCRALHPDQRLRHPKNQV